MTDLTNSFEGGTDGVTLTTGNSGGASGDAFAGVNAYVFTTAQKRGTMAVRVQNPGTTVYVVRWATTAATVASRAYIWLTTLPAADVDVLNVGDTVSMSFRVNSAGKARLNVGGTAQWTATANFPTAQWVRVEFFATASTNSADGTAKIAYYLGDSGSSVEASTLVTGLNTAAATGTFTNARFGKNSAGSYTGDIYLDDLAASYGAGTTGYIGPPPAPPASATDLAWTGAAWE